MQKKINDFQNYKTSRRSLKFKLVFLFFILISIFSLKYVFANVSVEFDKTNYSVMEGISTKIGFTIFNNSNANTSLLVWADCDDRDDEVSCNYSQRINVQANSSQTSSFYVTGIEESSTYLKLYIKNLITEQIREHRININVTSSEDDGYFEISTYNSMLCIGRTNKFIIEVNNNHRTGHYDFFLTNNTFHINQEQQNPIYLRNEKEINYLIFVPENTEEGTHQLSYAIENESISEIKNIRVNTRRCPEINLDFSVIAPSIIYHINKNQEKITTYTIKNNSRNYKTIYISEENTNEKINIEINKRQITLAPNSSEVINIKINTTTDIRSGNYDLNFNFFDGINNINRIVKLIINPEHNIEIQLLNNTQQTLVIGRTMELILLFKNKGDIREEFTTITTTSNDLKIRSAESTFAVNPHSTAPFSIYVSSGDNTQIGASNLNIKIRGKNSDFYEEYNFIINIIRGHLPTHLEVLAYPQTLKISQNTKREINFTLRNVGQEKVIIDNIEITNVPQEIRITSQKDIAINPQETKDIPITLHITEINLSEITAKVRFITRTGGILDKSIILTLEENEELVPKEISKFTGFFNLRNSLLTGVIIVCLSIILLFFTGVFKSKKI